MCSWIKSQLRIRIQCLIQWVFHKRWLNRYLDLQVGVTMKPFTKRWIDKSLTGTIDLAPRLEGGRFDETMGSSCKKNSQVFSMYSLELPPAQDSSHLFGDIPFLVGISQPKLSIETGVVGGGGCRPDVIPKVLASTLMLWVPGIELVGTPIGQLHVGWERSWRLCNSACGVK